MGAFRDAVICEPVRTPVGRLNGQFSSLSALELAVIVVEEVVTRTGLIDVIDDVIFGQSYASMEAAPIARVAALDAGLPVTVGGYQIDRRCGSGLQAVINAAMQVQTGASDVVLVGGVESMSNAPFYTTEARRGSKGGDLVLRDSLSRGRVTAGGRRFPTPGGMVETAENLRADYSISRDDQDNFALRSHRRAVAAQESGMFDDEIVPVYLRGRADSPVVRDEHPRADTSIETLARLRPIMPSMPGATVTAGNSSGQNDAAAACIVTTPERAAEAGLIPLVRLVSWARAGVDPTRMGIGPVPATATALTRAGLSLEDMGVIELNEAFASQVLAVGAEWGIGRWDSAEWDKINPNGGGISLGHPIGATGVRILAGMSRHMEREGIRYGLETMCIGGGQGLAAVFERM